MSRPAILCPCLCLCALALVCSAQSDIARLVQRRFLLLPDESEAGMAMPQSCAQTIDFTKILGYTGINPSDPNSTYDGILWRDLEVNGERCLDSRFYTTATYFEPMTVSDSAIPPDSANPWFAIGYDNAALVCATFSALLPLRYHFTDDLPRFRDRLMRDQYLPLRAAPSPLRGDLYAFVLGASTSGDVFILPACAYRAEGVTLAVDTTGVAGDGDSGDEIGGTGEPSSEPDGPACLSARMAVARHARRGVTRVSRVRVGHRLHGDDAVVSLSHFEPHVWASFVALTVLRPLTSNPDANAHANATAVLEVSGGHVLLLADGTSILARHVHRGHLLRALQARGGARVTRVSRVRRRGLFAPLTQSGTLVVHGVVLTCYTDAVPRMASAHALLTPVRAAFRLGVGDWHRVIDFIRRRLLVPHYFS